MSRRFETQPPEACLRLRDSRVDKPTVSMAVGELLRVLAASRPGGVFLCLGHDAGEAGAWIVDGMDLASRLVIVVENSVRADKLREVIDDDLRVTVHVQDMPAFLADVHDHRFDLIAELNPNPAGALANLSLARLALGGFFMSLREIPALESLASAPLAFDDGGDGAPDLDAFVVARLPVELGVTLIARRAPRPPRKRRGGRRTREGITPLFSSRPRGGG